MILRLQETTVESIHADIAETMNGKKQKRALIKKIERVRENESQHLKVTETGMMRSTTA